MAQDIENRITRAAQARGVDPAVAIAIARAESSLRPDLKNPKSSAKGLYQVTDETWSDYGGAKGRALDPDENIRVGMDILVKNGAMLAKTLGRDPRAEELYAAHFFGPTGSRRVLSADPLASISSVVSKRVMQSNPNLKGRTVNEVLTGFAKKLGTGGQRYPTSDVTRTVVPDAYSREADVEIATGTKAPTARDRISIYGPNYQAAVAAMMLGEATDDEQEDAASSTTAVEAQSARNSLRAMDLGSSVNPFDAMQPPPSKQPVQSFAFGGIAAPSAAYSPSVKREMADFNSQWEDYTKGQEDWRKTQYDPYQKAYGEHQAAYEDYRTNQYAPYQAAYDKYQSEVYAPYQAAHGQYTKDYAAYESAVADYNKDPFTGETARVPWRMAPRGGKIYTTPEGTEFFGSDDLLTRSDYSGYRWPDHYLKVLKDKPTEVVAPTLASEFTQQAPTFDRTFDMAAPTPAPFLPGLTQEQAAGMDDAALQTYADDQRIAMENKVQQARKGQQNRQFALDVASDPSRYGLSMPKLLAEGGEVQDDPPGILDVSKYATRRSAEMFPGMAGQDDPRDAARHLLAAGTVARKYGPTAADLLGKTHEYTSSLQTAASLFGIGEPRDDFAYDTHNNRLGIELGQRATSQAQLEQLVKEMAMQSSFQQEEGRPWIMSQEAMDARADRARQLMERPPDAYARGSEAVADDPEAALMAGAGDSPPPSITNDRLREYALAALRGVGDIPYSFAGSGVDIATMAMRPFGYDTERPVGGSDWIKEQATRLGIRPGDETDPTLANFRLAGEIGASMVNPASVPRAVATGTQKVGQAARALEDMTVGEMQRAKIRQLGAKVPDDAAYAALRERMEASGNLAMAVRPPGGTMVSQPGFDLVEFEFPYSFASIPMAPGASRYSFESNQIGGLDKITNEGIVAAVKATEDPAKAKAVANFLLEQGREYFSKSYASTNDPIYKALIDKRIVPVGGAGELVKGYMARQAKRDPEAMQDMTRGYDAGMQAYLAKQGMGEKAGSAATEQLALRTLEAGEKQQLTPEQIGKLNVDSGMPTFRNLENATDIPAVREAEKFNETLFNIRDFFVPSFLSPKVVGPELVNIPAEELSKMTYPQAVERVNADLLFKRDFYMVANDVGAGRMGSLGKDGKKAEKMLMFTVPFNTASKNKLLNWVRLTDSKGAYMEGKAMNHSVKDYNEYGTYNEGGKAAFDAGKAEIYSLRNKEGMPSLTVELANRQRPDGSVERVVTQIKGRFNSRPFSDTELFNLFDAIKPDLVVAEIYLKNNKGEALDKSVSVDWGKEYADYRAGSDEIQNAFNTYRQGGAEGFAKGGMVERTINDNRKYL